MCLFFFLSFLFTFLLLEEVSKSTCSFTVDKTNLFSLFLSFSEYIYNFQYLGRVEGKTVLSCTYLYERFPSQIPFFYGRAVFLYNLAEGDSVIFCPKILFYSFPGAWLTWRSFLAKVCPELKILFAGERARSFGDSSAHLFTPISVLKLTILFQISSDEKVLFFGAKGSDQSFGFFLPHLYFIQATTMTYIPFCVQPIIG